MHLSLHRQPRQTRHTISRQSVRPENPVTRTFTQHQTQQSIFSSSSKYLTKFQKAKNDTEVPEYSFSAQNKGFKSIKHFREKLTNQQAHHKAELYRNITLILEDENKNLKQHNQYLKQRLKQKNEQFEIINEQKKKYKNMYKQAIMEINKLKQQCMVQKSKADNMRDIALLDIQKLEQKLKNLSLNYEKEGNQDNLRCSIGRASSESKECKTQDSLN